jgi:hypothetical protein
LKRVSTSPFCDFVIEDYLPSYLSTCRQSTSASSECLPEDIKELLSEAMKRSSLLSFSPLQFQEALGKFALSSRGALGNQAEMEICALYFMLSPRAFLV